MKISNIILPALLLLKINNCFAQKDSTATAKYDRFYISLTGGIGIPVGRFAQFHNHTVDPYGYTINNLAGEARPGIAARLNGSYFFTRHFGYMASVYTGKFKAKDKSLDELFPENPNRINTSFTYSTKSWSVSGLMIGIIVCAPVSKFIFSIKFLGGVQYSASPQTDVSMIYQYNVTEATRWTQPTVSSVGFGWDSGLDVRFKAAKKINIMLSTDYLSGRANYKGNFQYNSIHTEIHSGYFDEYSATVPFENTMQISFFSITAGIAYILK